MPDFADRENKAHVAATLEKASGEYAPGNAQKPAQQLTAKRFMKPSLPFIRFLLLALARRR